MPAALDACLPPQIQNILDALATAAERAAALLAWQDPRASLLAVAAVVAAGLAAAVVGVPALVAAAVLLDLLPPRLRTPFPTPLSNAAAALPSRADRMM